MASAFLLAGESSGDLQGALLARELRRQRPDLELYGVGGERMESAGVELLFRSDELAVIGLTEVLAMLPRIFAAMDRVREFLSARRPDVFVPIDYPDFNLRLLPHAWRLGIPILYYIGPQVWAWRRSRLEWLKRYVDEMIVIFPFEEAIYRERGIAVSFVGHPLVDRVPADRARFRDQIRERLGIGADETVLALLPGSRRSEVARVAPVLAAGRERLDAMLRTRAPGLAERDATGPPGAPAENGRSGDGLRWIVGQAPGLGLDAARLLGCPEDTPRAEGFEALAAADLAWVASGTATLEALLLGTPSIVVYRVQPATYAVARRVVKVPHVAMANLIAGERVFPELIQDAADPDALAARTAAWLGDPTELAHIRGRLAAARETLGGPGAAGRAARIVLTRIDR